MKNFQNLVLFILVGLFVFSSCQKEGALLGDIDIDHGDVTTDFGDETNIGGDSISIITHIIQHGDSINIFNGDYIVIENDSGIVVVGNGNIIELTFNDINIDFDIDYDVNIDVDVNTTILTNILTYGCNVCGDVVDTIYFNDNQAPGVITVPEDQYLPMLLGTRSLFSLFESGHPYFSWGAGPISPIFGRIELLSWDGSVMEIRSTSLVDSSEAIFELYNFSVNPEELMADNGNAGPALGATCQINVISAPPSFRWEDGDWISFTGSWSNAAFGYAMDCGLQNVCPTHHIARGVGVWEEDEEVFSLFTNSTVIAGDFDFCF